MASLNQVQLIGNLGRDQEVRFTPSGSAVCNVTIATTRQWKTKEGEKQEETEWHRVVFYDKLAEIAGEYLRKGRPVFIQGRLKTRKWQDKEGKDTYTTEIIADQMQMLGGREDGGGQREQQTQKPQQQRQSFAKPGSAAGHGNAGGGFDDMDDQIPF